MIHLYIAIYLGEGMRRFLIFPYIERAKDDARPTSQILRERQEAATVQLRRRLAELFQNRCVVVDHQKPYEAVIETNEENFPETARRLELGCLELPVKPEA